MNFTRCKSLDWNATQLSAFSIQEVSNLRRFSHWPLILYQYYFMRNRAAKGIPSILSMFVRPSSRGGKLAACHVEKFLDQNRLEKPNPSQNPNVLNLETQTRPEAQKIWNSVNPNQTLPATQDFRKKVLRVHPDTNPRFFVLFWRFLNTIKKMLLPEALLEMLRSVYSWNILKPLWLARYWL